MTKSRKLTTRKTTTQTKSKAKAQGKPSTKNEGGTEAAYSSRMAAFPRYWKQWFVGTSLIITTLITVGMVMNIHTLETTPGFLFPNPVHDSRAYQRLRTLSQQVNTLRQQETTAEITVANDNQLEQSLALTQIDIQTGHHRLAEREMDRLQAIVSQDGIELAEKTAVANAATIRATGEGVTVPILIYHYTPLNFNQQLDELSRKHYTTISLDRLSAALHHTGSLPAKPVVITFDDGFANQMVAFHDLQRHHMVATYYIISGGRRSRWCIGAGRRNGDPLQPPSGCGDSYLTWSQVKQLDASGTITIGAHTVDHEDLAIESPAEQQFEITQNKQDLETLLGHPVHHFAYPYGSFTGVTVGLVQQAGFTTAVTTKPGLVQTLDGIYALKRVRNVDQLP